MLFMALKNPDEYQKGKTIVYLIRHGDRISSKNNKTKLKDYESGLSKKGVKQARVAAKKFAKIKDEIDVLYCSSMKRAVQTVKEIAKKIGKKPIIHDHLSEFNQIVWKGKFYHPKFWKHYRMHKLTNKFFDKILEENKGKVIVIVAHGNVIKGLIGKKLGLPLKQRGIFDYNNCHISLLRFKNKKLNYIHYINNKELV